MRVLGTYLVKTLSALGLFTSAGCADDHTPLSLTLLGDEVIASGEIDADSLGLFNDIIVKNPNVKTLVLKYVGGSVDDEANIEFARFVRKMGINTRVPSDGLVASGGTDLFLAGHGRVVEPGGCVGVHAWAAEDFTALDLSRSDPEHDRYLSYYKDIGIHADFYWFTLQAAPADAMHWMTAEEVMQFGMVTQNVSRLGSPEDCDDL